MMKMVSALGSLLLPGFLAILVSSAALPGCVNGSGGDDDSSDITDGPSGDDKPATGSDKGGDKGDGSGNGDGSGSGGSDDGGDDDGGDDGSSGGSSQCQVTQNRNEILCVDGACTCKVGGQTVGTCTARDPETACSSPGNCCGF